MSFYPDIECIMADFVNHLNYIKETEELDENQADAIKELCFALDEYAEEYHDRMEENYQYYGRFTYDPVQFIDDEIGTLARLNSGR